MSNKIGILSYSAGLGLSFLSAFLIPITPYLIFSFLLVFCDLLTGIAAAKKRKENLRSRRLMRTVEKVALYFLAILLSHGFDVIFINPHNYSFQMVYIVAGVISITELKSNFENIGEVTEVDFWNQIARLLPKFYKMSKKSKDDETDKK